MAEEGCPLVSPLLSPDPITPDPALYSAAAPAPFAPRGAGYPDRGGRPGPASCYTEGETPARHGGEDTHGEAGRDTGGSLRFTT